jgi:ABC-2 type transport system permease protein
MRTLIRVGLTNLRRDRVVQAMTFALPIIFFSIFATVFGGRDNGTARVKIAVVDEDHSDFSRRLTAGLAREASLDVQSTSGDAGIATPLTREQGEAMVKGGDRPVAVVIPSGAGKSFSTSGFAGGGDPILLLADVSDPVAPQMVYGLLQKVTMTSAPDLLMEGGLRQFEEHAGQLTPQQRAAVDEWLPRLRETAAKPGTDGSGAAQMGVGIRTVDVMRTKSDRSSLISFYAAGIGVMFLLFSMVGGAGGTLLDEVESGTLVRLLSTNIGMTGVLVGKWMFLSLIGIMQLCVMFLWAFAVFHLPLFSHVPGFLVMTVVTAGAAAALGLVLATLARSRGQLSGFSTILILTMSALGGSMFPRFLMSEGMQKMGLVTFNAWALDGYLKVFWRDAPIWQLWPQVGVLVLLTAAFLSIARLLARRWERA